MQFERLKLTASYMKDRMWPLFQRHYKEVSAYQDIKLDPNFQKYEELENAGLLRCYVAMDNGRMAGYSIYFLNKNLHYQSSFQAVQDVLFLDKSYRGKGAGKEFIDWCDQQLKADGVQVVYHHVKVYLDFGSILEDLGYRHLEKIYGRRLDQMDLPKGGG